MIKSVFKFFFKQSGWRIEGGINENIKKCVLIAAPHSSNWDFVFGFGALALFGFKVKYLAKKELFVFPLKRMFLSLGGIPVDRTKSNSLADAIADLFNSHDRLYIVFTPEGTRSRVSKWKSGFYYAALKANVPIVMGYLDYKEKVAFIGPGFMPSGDKRKDFETIREFYSGVTAKNPENFSLPEIEEAQN